MRIGLGMGLIPPSSVAAPTAPPVNVAAPSITGIRTQGQTVTADPGSWSGTPGSSYGYQWKRNGTNISGATAGTYVLTGTDVGQAITVAVTATNIIGNTTATSASITPTATLAISGSPPAATVGLAYTFTPTSAGGHTPKTYALTGTLPAGLSFAPSTGAITGTPSATGTASGLNITVTDADGLTASLGTFSIAVSAAGLPPGIVTGIEMLGDISIAITNPVSISVPMQTNGVGLKITTSGSAAHTALNLALPPVAFCRTRGQDANGNQVWQLHTVSFRNKLLGPYNEKTAYQPTAGQFYLVADDQIYNQDATWKTEILSIYFPAGWLNVEPEGSFDGAGITRSDSLTFMPTVSRDISIPFGDAVQSGGTFRFRLEAINAFAQGKSQIACVEAWLVDKDGLAGPETRISAMTISDLTQGTEPGRKALVYEGDLATTGLAAGLCHTRYRVKPWRGPVIESATYGQDMGEYLSPVKGVPVRLDLNGSWARLYGIVSDDPATATIASNTNVGTVDVSGLSTTIAGAIASGKTYANEGTLFTAVRRVNNSGSALTIAGPVSGTVSYQRTTTHNDCAGASAVCRPVAGSTPGSNTGAFTLRTQLDGYVPGDVAPEIRSESGLFSDDVRWRGVTSAGSQVFGFNVRTLPTRFILRGLYLDSVGLSTNNDVPVFSQWSSSDATKYTESTGRFGVMIDCKERGSTTNSDADTYSPMMVQCQMMHIRCDVDNVSCKNLSWGGNWYSHGLYVGIGSKYKQSVVSQIMIASLNGCHLINIGIDGQTSGIKPPTRGRVYINVDHEITNMTGVTRINVVAGDALGATPVRDGEGWLNCLVRGTASGSVNFTSWLIGGDATLSTIDGLVMHNCGSNFPNQAEGSGRINVGYNDSGYVAVSKRIALKACYFPGYNIKGDSFNTGSSGTTPATAPTHSTANAYFAGQVVKDGAGTLLYQALRDVPVSTLLSDTTYWFNSGNTPATAYGQQPRRQGNMALRYAVGSSGVVASSSQDSSSLPSATSWYGYAFPANGKYQSTRASWFASASTPSVSGDLYNRMAAGGAPAPYDLYGNAYPANDQPFHAGPVQIAA